MSTNPELLTPAEAAAALRVSAATMRGWIRAEKIASIRTPGGRALIPAVALEAILNGGTP